MSEYDLHDSPWCVRFNEYFHTYTLLTVSIIGAVVAEGKACALSHNGKFNGLRYNRERVFNLFLVDVVVGVVFDSRK